MKRDIPLTREQRELVENNLSLVYWVIMESIHVNETIYGFAVLIQPSYFLQSLSTFLSSL